MDAIETDDLDTLLAEAWLAGDGQAWHMVATVCASVHNSLMIAAAKQGGTVKEDDFRDAEHYLPPRWKEVKAKAARAAKPITVDWMKRQAGF